MNWLRKVRRALLAFSAKLKLRKSAGAIGEECGVGGLLKLQDDVQMCGYQDVQIMWNMLNETQPEEIITATTTKPSLKPNNKRRQQSSWRSKTFFWTSNAKSPVLVRLKTCSLRHKIGVHNMVGD